MIKLQVITDLTKETADGPLYRRDQVVEADIAALGRMPQGMTSGASSVAFIAKLREPLRKEDGTYITHIWAETSLAIFQTADAAFRGAEQRQRTGSDS